MSEGRGSHDGFDAVAEAAQVYEAELMALRLREAGIESQVLDQSYRQEPLPIQRSFARVQVLVPIAQADEARRLLALDARLPEDAESDPTDGPDDSETKTA
jgi:hypothetical protein